MPMVFWHTRCKSEGHLRNYNLHHQGTIAMKRLAASAFLSACVLTASLTHAQPSPFTEGALGTTHSTGRIDGRVMDSLTTRPIGGVQIGVYRSTSLATPVQMLMSDGSGHFRAELDSGTYVIKAQPPANGMPTDYRMEWYNNAADASSAMMLRVNESSRYDISIDLAPMVIPDPIGVHGTVMDSSGSPLAGARVYVLRSIQEMEDRHSHGGHGSDDSHEQWEIEDHGRAHGVVWQGWTDSMGTYAATVAPGHSYAVLAIKQGYAPQFFDHQADPLMANALWLTGDTTGIDFYLLGYAPAALYAVSGRVLDSAGTGVASRVALFPLRKHVEDRGAFFSYTDSTGAFTVQRVPAGRYLAFAVPFGGFAPAYHHRHGSGIARWQMADTIIVQGDITGLELRVARIVGGGSSMIHGRTTASGQPLRGATVYAAYPDGSIAGVGLSDQYGAYAIAGLVTDQVIIRGELDGFVSGQTSIVIPQGQLTVNGVDLVLSTSSATAVDGGVGTPGDYLLDQNYPNPFNPSTTIAYSLPAASTVSIRIFNIVGQEVAALVNGVMASGRHEAVWNGRDRSGMALASGVYIYRYEARPLDGSSPFVSMKRMLLLK